MLLSQFNLKLTLLARSTLGVPNHKSKHLIMQQLRLIPYSVQSATFNMAADEFLLSQAGSILRFYGWSDPTLSFGRFNPILEEIDLAVCKKNDISFVKRITGGKTVLHHLELTYAISADTQLFSDSILQTYKMISQPLAACLNQFGVPAEILPTRRRKSQSSICFSEVSAYELAVGKKKIVGSAQLRRATRFLQHGSILLDLDWKLWKAIWKLPSASTALEDRITTVKLQTTMDFNRDLFIRSFARSLAGVLSADLYQKDFSTDEYARISELSKKYQWLPAGLD